MSKKQKKTLVEKYLDKEKIYYHPWQFETHLKGDVYEINQNIPPNISQLIFKTLVLKGKNTEPFVGVVPIKFRINDKKMSLVTQNKKVSLVPLKDLFKTSGYLHGENTPIGIYQNKHFKIYYDQVIEDFDEVIVSAGEIGKMIQINAKELIKITNGIVADIAERNENV